jgi:hypothetical protein
MLSVLCCAAGTARAQGVPALDQFLCLRAAPTRHADRALKFTPRTHLGVRDRFTGGGVKLDVKKPAALCLPAAAPGATLHDAVTHLEWYAGRLSRTRPTQPKPVVGDQHVTNRFGADDLRVKTLTGLLVPTGASFDSQSSPPTTLGAVDHFTCWSAARTDGPRSRPASDAPLELATALGTLLVDVRAPAELCFPADTNGNEPTAPAHPDALACYTAKLTRTKPPQADPFPRDAATANHFGSEQLTANATLAFCVPSQASGVGASPTPAGTATPTPTPTTTPPPDFTLRVNPALQTVNVGESAHFTATAVFKNGDTVDFTERVAWRSGSNAAEAPNVTGDRGRIDAVDVGSAAVSVLDEATGVTSTDTGEDALLTVAGTLERIELLPTEATRGKGESIRLRATGHFAGGYTRDIAYRLTYASTNDAVAHPTNDPVQTNHSRIIAAGEGAATISATDPLSGLTSTQSGDDVALTVLPPLETCSIIDSPFYGWTFILGADHQFTARGYYQGDFERNLTQQAIWASDAPGVVEAPNRDGDRSRVITTGPGQAHITATDSVTGILCDNAATVTVGAPGQIYLVYDARPGSGRPIRAGKTRRVAARQYFPPTWISKNMTENMTFETGDPSVLVALNTPGDRGLLLGVGSGTTSVIAHDPVTGNTSQPLYFRVLDGLTRVIARQNHTRHTVVKVGDFVTLSPIGVFADGEGPLDFADLTITSSNPSVVGFYEPFHVLRGFTPGTATISVVDNATGISSDAFGDSLEVGVRGPLQSITVIHPATRTRVGIPIGFGAVAHYVGGVSEIETTSFDFSSSDPSVAVVPSSNSFWDRSVANPIAGGTTVINATDPKTGISSADSGGGSTLTVVGPLQRLTVSPSTATRSLGRSFSFTATGRDADGREINLTQQVEWVSTDESVAVAPNDPTNRSRIDSVGLGTTTISAHDPVEGVTSTATGDDATLVVDGALASLTLAAEQTQIPVNGVTQLTATGHLVGGATVNLTQEVEYTSSDPTVAQADNPPGDRSRILALKPGTAVISARNPSTGIVTAPGGTVTLTVVAP